MKKLSLFIFALLLINSIIVSQWQTYQTAANSFFSDVAVIDQNNIWACGSGGIVVKTANGGSTWVTVNNGLTGLACHLISAADQNYAWVTAGPNNDRIFRTTNGGINWTEQFYGNPAWIDGINFFSNSTGTFLAGPETNNDTAKFYYTRNGGLNWNRSSGSPLTSLLVYGCFGGVDTNFIWFIDNDKFYKLSGGLNNSWQVHSIDTYIPFLTASYFVNSNTGYAGDGGIGTPGFVLYKTTNGGVNWSVHSSDSGMGLTSLEFIPGTNMAFVSGINEIRVSTNSGVNWQYRKKYTLADSMSFGFMDANDTNSVWLTNSKGRMLKYNFAYIGINQISTEVPDRFIIYQNYPNPFNPTTKIKFDLPGSGSINFKVYDVLGKVIYSLNENKSAGTFELTFNGNDIASGIYYYSVESNGLRDVKKMVLLK